MRTLAREVAFKIVFASCFTGKTDESLAKSLKKSEKLNNNDSEYVDKVVSLVSEHKEQLLRIIDERSRMFPESRLFPADKSVLLVALAEINYMDDIPSVVSINEAANLASKYSTAKSASFISGILSEIIRG